MKFILGTKLDMTQVWRGDEVIAVTKVQAGPCTVVQVKTPDKDGYEAVQVGYGERKEKNIRKPQLARLKKLEVRSRKSEGEQENKTKKQKNKKTNLKYLREFRIKQTSDETAKNIKVGDMIDVGVFTVGDKAQVTGVSKGKGFQGVVKRHGFHGQNKTHGTKDQHRMPGSIGATGPAHVFKGTRMPGRMGGDRTTVKNLEIIEVDKENNVLLIRGAVPGARNGLVLIAGDGELKVAAPQDMKQETKNMEQENNNNKEETAEPKKEEDPKEKIVEKKKDEEPKKEEIKKTETSEDVEREVVEAKEKVDHRSEGESKK